MNSLWTLDLVGWIINLGYIGVTATVFAESGLLIGVFLPGDTLLFTAGLLASQKIFNLGWLLLSCSLAAIIGDNVGYSFGRRVGPKLFTRQDSLFFRKDYIAKTQHFYSTYGAKVVIFARFLPVVRSLAPILAGVGQMEYRIFFWYNVIGGILWTALLLGLGYILGSTVKDIDHYLLPIILLIVVVSVIPSIWEIWRVRRKSKNLNT